MADPVAVHARLPHLPDRARNGWPATGSVGWVRDALLREATAVASGDPIDGTEIDVCLEPDGEADWRPSEAVVGVEES